jgi:hypothetical protein
MIHLQKLFSQLINLQQKYRNYLSASNKSKAKQRADIAFNKIILFLQNPRVRDEVDNFFASLGDPDERENSLTYLRNNSEEFIERELEILKGLNISKQQIERDISSLLSNPDRDLIPDTQTLIDHLSEVHQSFFDNASAAAQIDRPSEKRQVKQNISKSAIKMTAGIGAIIGNSVVELALPVASLSCCTGLNMITDAFNELA